MGQEFSFQSKETLDNPTILPAPELKRRTDVVADTSTHLETIVNYTSNNNTNWTDYTYELYFGLPGKETPVPDFILIMGFIETYIATGLTPGTQYSSYLVGKNKKTGKVEKSATTTESTTGVKPMGVIPDPPGNPDARKKPILPAPELKRRPDVVTDTSTHLETIVNYTSNNNTNWTDYTYVLYFGLPGKEKPVPDFLLIMGFIETYIATGLIPGTQYSSYLVGTHKTNGKVEKSAKITESTTGVSPGGTPTDPPLNRDPRKKENEPMAGISATTTTTTTVAPVSSSSTSGDVTKQNDPTPYGGASGANDIAAVFDLLIKRGIIKTNDGGGMSQTLDIKWDSKGQPIVKDPETGMWISGTSGKGMQIINSSPGSRNMGGGGSCNECNSCDCGCDD